VAGDDVWVLRSSIDFGKPVYHRPRSKIARTSDPVGYIVTCCGLSVRKWNVPRREIVDHAIGLPPNLAREIAKPCGRCWPRT